MSILFYEGFSIYFLGLGYDRLRFQYIQNNGIVDNNDFICNNDDGSPPFNSNLELVARSINPKCILMTWIVLDDGFTGAGFSFEFSVRNRKEFNCDPLNGANDDNRNNPIYLGIGETYTMTSHADWDGVTNWDESNLNVNFNRDNIGWYGCYNMVCVSDFMTTRVLVLRG